MSLYATISAAALLITTFLLWNRLRDANSQASRIPALVTWAIACIALALFLYPRLYTPMGLSLGFYNALLLTAFFVATLSLLTSLSRPTEYLGVIILPITLLCLLSYWFFIDHRTSTLFVSPGTQIHIVSSILAFGTLCLAAVQACVVFFQNRRLKQHAVSGWLTLPSMQESEHTMFQFIAFGWLALSVSLVSGFIYLENIFQQHLVHKTVLSILAWVVFLILLFGRWRYGWRGPNAIRGTLGGFFFLLLAYLGSKFVLDLVLDRV